MTRDLEARYPDSADKPEDGETVNEGKNEDPAYPPADNKELRVLVQIEREIAARTGYGWRMEGW